MSELLKSLFPELKNEYLTILDDEVGFKDYSILYFFYEPNRDNLLQLNVDKEPFPVFIDPSTLILGVNLRGQKAFIRKKDACRKLEGEDFLRKTPEEFWLF